MCWLPLPRVLDRDRAAEIQAAAGRNFTSMPASAKMPLTSSSSCGAGECMVPSCCSYARRLSARKLLLPSPDDKYGSVPPTPVVGAPVAAVMPPPPAPGPDMIGRAGILNPGQGPTCPLAQGGCSTTWLAAALDPYEGRSPGGEVPMLAASPWTQDGVPDGGHVPTPVGGPAVIEGPWHNTPPHTPPVAASCAGSITPEFGDS